MKIYNKPKKIILIWDFDGAIGQINSSYPYNFNFDNFETELNNVKEILELLKKYNIKCCFAITGFSAEKGVYPYVFPDLIREIKDQGHEVASHSWRHEWSPIFKLDQIDKSLKRSKKALENSVGEGNILGFVPPHNRPMTWWQRGAFSLGDRGVFPFFKLGNNEQLIQLLKRNNYKWIRISYANVFHKLKIFKKNCTGKVFKYKGMLIFENHYTGFDKKVIEHILNTNYETYTISAHPFMYSLLNKKESKKEFLNFLETLTNSKQNIEFVLPNSFV